VTWRAAFAIVVASAAGCASAGAPDQGQAPIDAPRGTADAPRQVQLDAAPPVDGAAATCTPSPTPSCQAATALAAIGGDEDGAAASNQTGYQAAWFSIRINETDSSAFADPMSMQTTLTSPPGVAFDLLVFEPGDASSTECTTPSGSITTTGTSESSSLEWGETGTFANDSDDSRTITIEITPHAGDACSPNDTWSLSILTGVD
jgi:hypothetical protein